MAEGFTVDDHDRLARVESALSTLAEAHARLAAVQRRLPGRVARQVEIKVSRRGAVLIAVGVMIGSAVGNLGGDVVRRLVLQLIGVH